jgi:CHASE3 domain sensor protein
MNGVIEPITWTVALRPFRSLGFLLLTGVVVANAGASFWNISTLATTNRLTVHTHEVLTQIEETLSLLKDAETGQRGYLITGEPRYLQPFEDAAAGIHQRFKRLRELTADNASQQARTERLESLIAERFEELDLTIALRKEKGFDAARSVVLEDHGKTGMDDLRRLMAEMEAEEQGLLQIRTIEAERRVCWTLTMLVLVTCLVLGFSLVRRLVAERQRAEIMTSPLVAAHQREQTPPCTCRASEKTGNEQHA